MGNFQRGGDRGGFKGGKSFGAKKPWDRGESRGGDRGEVRMHKTVCSDCGKTCDVPFKPSGDKPVFCNECFSGKRDGGRDDGRERNFNSRPAPRSDYKQAPAYKAPVSDDSKRMLSEIAAKLDRLFIAVERMSEMKTREVVTESAPVIVPKVIAKKSASKEVVKKAVKAAPAKKVAVKVAKKATTKKVAAKKAK